MLFGYFFGDSKTSDVRGAEPPENSALIQQVDAGVSNDGSLLATEFEVASISRNGVPPPTLAVGTYHVDTNICATFQGVTPETDSVPRKSGRQRRRAIVNGFYVEDVKREPKKRKREKEDAEEEFQSVWICCECKEAECMINPDAEQLLICEGLCQRLSHYPCAGLACLPAEDEPYICKDCHNERHPCAICQEYGHDNEDVFLCSNQKCGLFFHEHCLLMQNVDVRSIPGDSSAASESCSAKSLSGSEDGPDVADPSIMARRLFVCPAHACWTCTQVEEQVKEQREAEKDTVSKISGKGRKPTKPKKSVFESKTNEHLVRCLECPRSYHITCIPPSARFHELATLCHEHANTHKLPELDHDSSLQSAIEKRVERKFQFTEQQRIRRRNRKGKNSFFVGVSGAALTLRETKLLETLGGIDECALQAADTMFFCLPCDIKDEVHSKPPTYRHIHSLRYDPHNKPPRIPPSGETCQCIGVCDGECLNRVLYTECFGAIEGKDWQSTRQKHTNCHIGPTCGNRQMAQRRFKKCKPVREHGKGWGLIVEEAAYCGELVIEYVGEVVDAKMKERRLNEWTKEHPNDPNFYVMSLVANQWFIDARLEANHSRFINHSCDPNCNLTAINVNGYIRNGVFAKRDIAPGEFLSYDYKFDTRHADRFNCRCGSANCRGTMKDGKKEVDANNKTKSELWEEAKAKYERDKRFVEEHYERLAATPNLTDVLVPGASSKDDFVANGPPANKHRASARGIFLWRTADRGADFKSRADRLDHE